MLIDEVGEGGERIMWIRNRHQTHKKGNIVSRPNSTILMILMEPMVASDGDTPSAEPRPIFFSLSSPLSTKTHCHPQLPGRVNFGL